MEIELKKLEEDSVKALEKDMLYLHDGVLINQNYSSFINFYSDSDKTRFTASARKGIISTPQLIKGFSKQILSQSCSGKILPNFCKFVSNNYRDTSYIIEIPPAVRTLKFQLPLLDIYNQLLNLGYESQLIELGLTPHTITNGKIYDLPISLPYLIFFIIIDINKYIASNLVGRLSPLNSLDDHFISIPLPNINIRQELCIGNMLKTKSILKDNNEYVNLFIETFFRNSFNLDYFDNVILYANSELYHPLMWAIRTIDDPMFIYRTEWKRSLSPDNFFTKTFSSSSQPTVSDFINLISQGGLDDFEPNSSVISDTLIDGDVVSINDELIIDGTIYYINGFEVDAFNPNIIRNVLIESQNGEEVKKLKFDKIAIQYIKDSIEANRLKEAIIANGTVVKVGDAVRCSSPSLLGFVSNINRARDGLVEVRINRQYSYFANTLHADVITSPHGDLKIGDEIFMDNFRGGNPTDYIRRIGVGKIFNLSFRNNRAIIEYLFGSNSTKPIAIARDDILTNEMCNVPFVNVGNTVIRPTGEDKCFIDTKEKMIFFSSSISSGNPQKSSFNSIEEILDNQKVVIPTYYNPITLEKGECVIFPDFSNLSSLYDTHEITGFEIDEDELIVTAKSLTIGNIKEISYAQLGASGIIFLQSNIRKITTELNGVKAGSKIRAKKTGIKMFPKKDVHEVIGIITDVISGPPLVLMSNFCTRGLTEEFFNSFYIYPKSYNIKVTAPQKPVPPQIGDLATRHGDDQPVWPDVIINDYQRKYYSYSDPIGVNSNEIHACSELFLFPQQILLPRLSTKQLAYAKQKGITSKSRQEEIVLISDMTNL